MSRRPTNFWDFLIHLTKTISAFVTAIVGFLLTMTVFMLFTPFGWFGIMILMVVYSLISGNHGTYP